MENMRFHNILFTLVFLGTFISQDLYASIFHAPANFSTSYGNVVFADFQEATYNITYDSNKKLVSAVSTISFLTSEEGMPLFDLLDNPTQIILDNEVVQNKIIQSPDKDTQFRIMLKNLKPGLHSVIISSPMTSGISFLADGVSSAFWFSDLDDRSYLENYLPANYEFDQYKMTFNFEFIGAKKQKIYSNGKVTKLSDTNFSVQFPSTYTSSSLYLHTAPEGRFKEIAFNYHSIDGRDIPGIAYGSNPEGMKKQTLISLAKLESEFGPFLHQSVTIFNPGGNGGGMEYCGATVTSLWALNHELTHSYFARGGFMPANGNSGWIDEAITTWSDEGSKSNSDLGSMRSNMAGHSQYRRLTDDDAYTKGRDLMANLHYKFQANGGLKSFLNQLIQTDSFHPMTTEEFVFKISNYYSEDLTSYFKKYVYSSKKINSFHESNPMHLKMSILQMRKFL